MATSKFHININNRQITLLISLFLIAAILVCYGQVKRFEFVAFDDNLYITQNRHVQDGLTIEGLIWSFTTGTMASNFWLPLTWMSHMLDSELYGMNAGGHHLTSLFFHIANTLLLFFVFNRMSGALWRSGFVAALFALHPLHVESVAWVAERKDVLSTFFWLLTMWAYVRYTDRPGLHRYFPVLLFFVLGLMSKPMLVTLPFVLLLLDYWPLSRYQSGQAEGVADGSRPKISALRLIWEKIPLFLFSAEVCVVTVLFGQTKALDQPSLSVRIANALVSYAGYIKKMIWPDNLAIFYPHSGMPPGWQVAGAILLFISILILAIRAVDDCPYFLVGWLWYIGTLVPVIGLVQNAPHAMADRYTYVPLIGLFVIIAWGIPDLLVKLRYQKIILAASAVLTLFVLSLLTFSQVRHWENSIALFENAIHATRNNWLAHINLGAVLSEQGRLDEAVIHYREALRIKPDNADAHNNLALAFSERGNHKEADMHFKKALMSKPESASIHYNFGVYLMKQERVKEAYVHFAETIKFKPDHAEAYNILGIIIAKDGQYNRARSFFSRAIQVRPDYADARKNLELLDQVSSTTANQINGDNLP
ncbi:tetratricopeptide repeat protein [Thermodesulfobacteriota bacterium]